VVLHDDGRQIDNDTAYTQIMTPPAGVNVREPRLRELTRVVARDPRVRYVVVGGVASVIYYSLFSAGWLVGQGRVPYLLVAVLANVATAVLSYPLYRRGVFAWDGPWLPGFLRFYVIGFWSLMVSLIGLPLLIELGHVPVLVAQAILLLVVPVVNYQVNKHWTFRRR